MRRWHIAILILALLMSVGAGCSTSAPASPAAQATTGAAKPATTAAPSSAPAATIAAPAAAAATTAMPTTKVTWKWQVSEAVDGQGTASIDKWVINEVSKRTNGNFTIKPAWIGELFQLQEITAATIRGDIQMGEVSPSWMARDVPGVAAVELPGMATSFDSQQKLIDSLVALNKERYSDSGLEYLMLFNYADNGLFSRKPITGKADFQGLKLRVYSEPLTELVSKVGGSPATLAAEEILVAAQRGALDGSFTGVSYGYQLKWHEMMPNVLRHDMFYVTESWFANKKAVADLPAEYRQVLFDVTSEAQKQLIDKLKAYNGQVWDKLLPAAGAKVNTLPVADKQAVQELMRPFNVKYLGQYGAWGAKVADVAKNVQ